MSKWDGNLLLMRGAIKNKKLLCISGIIIFEVMLLMTLTYSLCSSVLYTEPDFAWLMEKYHSQKYEGKYNTAELIYESRIPEDDYVCFEQKYLLKSENGNMICQLAGRIVHDKYYNVTNILFDDGIKQKEIRFTSVDSIKNLSVNLIKVTILVDAILYFSIKKRYRLSKNTNNAV